MTYDFLMNILTQSNNIKMESLIKEIEAQKTVYLRFENMHLMRKNDQVLFIHHIPGYMSQIEFKDAKNFFTEEYEIDYLTPCSKLEFLEAYNQALKVINSKIC